MANLGVIWSGAVAYFLAAAMSFCSPALAQDSRETCLDMLMTLTDPQPRPFDFFDLSRADLHSDFYWDGRSLTPAERIEQTEQTLDLLNNPTVWPTDEDTDLIPSPILLQTIYEHVKHHPVAALCHLPQWDPTGIIGYCFGRAMAAHLEAMVHGISERRMMKLFALGRFVSIEGNSKERWSYHVATIVRASDNQWYTIDPRRPGPELISDWLEYWKTFAADGVALYATHPRRLDPTLRYYSPAMIKPGFSEYPQVRAYFENLIRSYQARLVNLMPKT